MRAIEVSDIGTAWEESVRHVLRKGIPITTEDNEETLETDELVVKVQHPSSGGYPKNLPYGQAYLSQYAHDLIYGGENDDRFAYTYHGRLFDYGDSGDEECCIAYDQIGYIIGKLQEQPVSRRAQAITWNPFRDCCVKDVPCLQWTLFLIRDGKLNMKVLFRSNDILMAMYANMYALVALQAYVAHELNVPVGTYTHIVTVPHIYHKRDANEVEKWL